MSDVISKNVPKVGLQVLVIKQGKILIGKHLQKGNIFGVPGGHWDSGETLEDGAKREVLEESGIVCDNLKFVCNYEFYREDNATSYVSISYVADYKSGEPKDDHDEDIVDWNWMSIEDALKLDLYPAARVLIERYVEVD